jgi:hypothetical protein
MRIEELIISHASDIISHASNMTGCDYFLFVALYRADCKFVIFGVSLFLTLLVYIKVELFGCRVLVRVTRVPTGSVELLLQQLAFKGEMSL